MFTFPLYTHFFSNSLAELLTFSCHENISTSTFPQFILHISSKNIFWDFNFFFALHCFNWNERWANINIKSDRSLCNANDISYSFFFKWIVIMRSPIYQSRIIYKTFPLEFLLISFLEHASNLKWIFCL